jgi:hypothetical protein
MFGTNKNTRGKALARFSLSKVPPRRFIEVGSEELVGNPSGGMMDGGSMLPECLKKSSFFLLLSENKVLPSGFEPESKPREGFMIGRYTTGAFFLSARSNLYYRQLLVIKYDIVNRQRCFVF